MGNVEKISFFQPKASLKCEGRFFRKEIAGNGKYSNSRLEPFNSRKREGSQNHGNIE